jgi:hypothetical protein
MPRTAYVSLPSVPVIGVFLDGHDFFQYCRSTFQFMDVITYTCQDFACCPAIRRLIVGISHISKKTEVGICPYQGFKTFSGIHTKLFLGYDKKGLKDAFVGSQNLVTPTLNEVIVRTNAEQRDYLARYFEQLWSGKKDK